jgi:glycosyltransferase involved in cell wall biosynthesis
MKKVYYWAPFFTKIATEKAVLNSYIALKKNKKNKIKIINSVGEWSHINSGFRFDFNKKTFLHSFLKKEGYIRSRIFSLFVFIISYRKLMRILKDENSILIAHLITSLPILINFFLKRKKSNLILRISGMPRLNFFRKYIWKNLANKCYLVTSPTEETMKNLIKNKIFNKAKIKLLKDPVLQNNSQKLYFRNYSKKKNFLCVGRLTDQKNFSFIIDCFNEISKKGIEFNLNIFGSGEQKDFLKYKIKNVNLENKIKLMGYEKNIEKIYKEHDCFISCSKWEDPGFAIIEAASHSLPIISSDCPSGPREILKNGELGYLYKSNNINDFKKKFFIFFNDTPSAIRARAKKLKKNLNDYTYTKHSANLLEIIKK